MKKVFRVIAQILCIGAILYIAGTWVDEEVTRAYALVHNGSAILVALICGLYIRSTEEDGKE